MEKFLPDGRSDLFRTISLQLLNHDGNGRSRDDAAAGICVDLQKQVDMIWHDHISVNRNGRIVFRDLFYSGGDDRAPMG